MNILVVDDDERILTLVEAILGGLGHRVTATTDARRAIEAIDRGGVDLLMSDVAMPEMNGAELVAAARRLRPGLPALLISGWPMVGSATFLAKPFRAQGLLNALHRALALSDSSARSMPGHPPGPAGTPHGPGLRHQ